jgi:U2-associated protein SR140
VAAEIKGHGFKYEETLREREQNNPKYAFLRHQGVSSVVQLLTIG